MRSDRRADQTIGIIDRRANQIDRLTGTSQSTDFGIHCRFGWHDSYTYSKALAELAAVRAAKEYGIPVLILRPSIVESAMREPEP